MADAVVGTAKAEPLASVITRGYRRYALALLVAIYTFNFLDRAIVTTLLEPIKEELHLNDTEAGAMAGLWFGLFYTVLGIPLARWADRGDRPLIMTIAVTVWSGFTVLGGMAQNFLMLAVSRIGVGVGEAGCSPTAHSLISDYTPRDRRASAMAVYALGTPIGTMLGMALGALIAERFGWRAAFFVAGAPGLVFGLLALATLKEPRRQLKSLANAVPRIPLREVIAVLRGKPTFWLLAVGSGLGAMIGYAHANFMPSYFIRNHTPELTALASQFGMLPRGFLGVALGLGSGLGGIVGALIGGKIADRLGAKDLRWYVTIPALAPLISTPIFLYAISTDHVALALPLLTLPHVFLTLWYGPVYGGVQSLVPGPMRAVTAALLLLIINVIGMIGGPTLFGAVNDALANHSLADTGLDVETCKHALGAAKPTCAAAGAGAIRTSMMLSPLVLIPMIGCYWISRRYIRRDMES